MGGVRDAAGQRAEVGRGRGRERHVADPADQLGDGSGRVDHLPGGDVVALGQPVPHPDLRGVDADRLGEPVHLRLVAERGLHRPEPAHRAARRVVGVGAVAVDRDVGDDVRPGAQRGRVGDDGRRAGGVGAAVEHDLRAHVEQPAVVVGAVLVAHPRRVAVHVPEERLLAGVDHLHRPAGAQRQHARVHVHRQVLAPAEGAADAGQRDPDERLVEAQRVGDLAAVDVQPLGGDVEVDAAVRRGHGEAGLRAEEGLVLHADLVLAGDDDGRRAGRVAAPDLHVPHRVAAVVDHLALAPDGGPGVGDGRQLLVVDLDQGRRAAGGLGVVRRDHRDGLALVAHPVVRQHRLVAVLEPERVRAGHVLVREHREDAGDGERGRRLDVSDPGVGVRAAQRGAPQHPVHPQVGGERELAAHLEPAVGTRRALADAVPDPGARVGGGHRPLLSSRVRVAPAARCASARSSVVRRTSSSTTVRPSTRSRASGGREPSTSAATGSSQPA